MGGRAGSHGGPCARCLPVSWRAAGSCSSSAVRRGAVLCRRPRRQPRLAAWSRGRPQARRRARRSLRLLRPRRRSRQHHPRRLRQRPRRRRRRPRQRPRLREQHRPRQPGRRLRHRPRRLLLRRRLAATPSATRGLATSRASSAAMLITAKPGWQATARRSSARTTMAGAGSLSDPGYVRASQAGCRGSSLWTMMSACSAGRAVSK